MKETLTLLSPKDNQNYSEVYLSVIVPIFNEVESLPVLIAKIADVLQESKRSYEIIAVDDGSQDGSAELLQKLARSRHDLVAIIFRRKYIFLMVKTLIVLACGDPLVSYLAFVTADTNIRF